MLPKQASEVAPESRPQQPTPAVDLVAVRALIEPLAVAHGLQIHDVLWSSERGGNILRVTLERPLGEVSEPDGPHALGGGVTVDDCARVSRDVSTVLDAEDVIDPRYTLEVSSPGADRQLVGEEDFRRYLGRNVKVKLTEPAADGQRVLRGAIRSVGDGVVAMEVDGNHHDVTLGNVAQARLVFDLGAQPKGGARRPGARRRNPSKGRSGKPATGGRPSAPDQRDDDPGV